MTWQMGSSILIVLTLMTSGCMPARPAAQLQVDNAVAARVAEEFERRIAADTELTGWLQKVSDIKVNPVRGWVDFTITIDGQRWTEITRSQQDRIARKLGNHLKDAHAAAEPGGRRQINMMVNDDTGLMGVIIALDGNFSSNLRR